jgi:hypothetical protein
MRTLKIESLPNKKHWVDKDFIILHACFQILKDFVDEEKGNTHCNYDAHKSFVNEVNFLYNWWKERKNKNVVENYDKQMKEDDKMLIRLMKIRTSLWT